jgi:hypothetical protein
MRWTTKTIERCHHHNGQKDPGECIRQDPVSCFVHFRYLFLVHIFPGNFQFLEFFFKFFLVRLCLKNFNRDHEVLVNEPTIG